MADPVDVLILGAGSSGYACALRAGQLRMSVGQQDVEPLVHAHHTQNEALGEAHLALAGNPLHAHG